MNDTVKETLSKVPAATLGFWIVKILATTLGETGGDALSMTLDLGYALSSAIFAAIFVIFVSAQIRAKAFHRFLYWAVVVATTTLGTTMADFADRSIGIGYAGGASLLLFLLLTSFAVWRKVAGSIATDDVVSHKAEAFYWVTILFSQTLGTALGDWMADTNGLGFEKGSLVFAAAIAVIALAWRFTKAPHALLFWSAFILTRPLGATLGDLIDKPVSLGGFAVGRFVASGLLLAVMIGCILAFPQKPGRHKASAA